MCYSSLCFIYISVNSHILQASHFCLAGEFHPHHTQAMDLRKSHQLLLHFNWLSRINPLRCTISFSRGSQHNHNIMELSIVPRTCSNCSSSSSGIYKYIDFFIINSLVVNVSLQTVLMLCNKDCIPQNDGKACLSFYRSESKNKHTVKTNRFMKWL